MPDTLILASKEKAAAIALENELSDIFDLIKITHRLACHFDSKDPVSTYGDDETALVAAIMFLREKTAKFETLYYGANEGKSS